MRRPEGTLIFRYRSDQILNPEAGPGKVMEVTTGGILFSLARDAGLNLSFIHSSPGTGTRVASVDLAPLSGSKALRIALVWSPNETRVQVFDAENPERVVQGRGELSKKQLRVGKDGGIYQVGDEGLHVMGAEIYQGGKPILSPTALESWTMTLEGIRVLFTGRSDQGYLFEAVTSNLAIVMLVTGFEAYCKRRFLEVEDEGIEGDFQALAQKFLSAEERKRGMDGLIRKQAKNSGITPAAELVEERRIDFQNFERCKIAYKQAHGLGFGEDLGISNSVLGDLQRFIGYRHRIVHVSPLVTILNQEKVPPDDPVFPKRELVERAIQVFDEFIQALHRATLKLRP